MIEKNYEHYQESLISNPYCRGLFCNLMNSNKKYFSESYGIGQIKRFYNFHPYTSNNSTIMAPWKQPKLQKSFRIRPSDQTGSTCSSYPSVNIIYILISFYVLIKSIQHKKHTMNYNVTNWLSRQKFRYPFNIYPAGKG